MYKSPVPRGGAGNYNMRGSKGTKVLACQCCFVIGDLKDKALKKIVKKEVDQEIASYYTK